MQDEAQILIDLNTQLHSETVVSVQNEDPGVSSSLVNAVIMSQQPGQFLTLNLIFLNFYSSAWLLAGGVSGLTLACLSFIYSSEKTNKAVGCLDSPRGRKLLHRIAASWEGILIRHY